MYDSRVWAHWNHSFYMHLNCLGPVSSFSLSWIPSGCTDDVGSCSCWLDGSNILCLLIMEGNVFHPELNSVYSVYVGNLASFSIITLRFIHVVTLTSNSFLFTAWVFISFMYIQQHGFPVTCWWNSWVVSSATMNQSTSLSLHMDICFHISWI